MDYVFKVKPLSLLRCCRLVFTRIPSDAALLRWDWPVGSRQVLSDWLIRGAERSRTAGLRVIVVQAQRIKIVQSYMYEPTNVVIELLS